MTPAQQIAVSILGEIRWLTDTHGYCKCPGEDSHSSSSKSTDCEVYVDNCAHLHCFHSSCEDAREGQSALLRLQLGNAGINQASSEKLRAKRSAEAKIKFDPAALAQHEITSGLTPRWLASRGVPLELMVTPEDFLQALYPERRDNILVFVDDNETQGTALWPREKFYGSAPNGVWFQPQPVTGKWVVNTRTGKRSRRTMECVTDFRYLVAESDEAPPAQWLSYLVKTQMPIIAIYHSGGRSIHALIEVQAANKEQWEARTESWRRELIIHGADRRALTAIRLTRLPLCWRGKVQQRLMYFNPAPLPATSIWEGHFDGV